MKLAIDIRSLMEGQFTGVSRYASEVSNYLLTANEIDARGISVGSKVPIVDERARSSVHHIAGSSRIDNLRLLLRNSTAFSRALNNADLIWLPNIAITPKLKKPYVLTVHDLSFVRHPYFYGPRERLWHALVGSDHLIKNATRIIAVSNSTKSELLHYFPTVRPESVHVIHLGVSAPKQSLIRPAKKYLLYVGTLEPRKNIDTLLEAHAELTSDGFDIELIIAGKKGWMTDSIIKKVLRQKNVTWKKYATYDELQSLYSGASALVWPSLYEGFGLPPVEALSYGIPVIVSERTSLPEILGKNAVYVNPYNVIDLVEVLKQALAHPKTSVPISTRTWSAVANDHLTLFKEYENRN